MIEGASPVTQALLGTLFTWGLTAAGSAVVFLLSGTQRKVLDGSLGFAAGVMTAASFWSLLAPAIELAETSGSYGENGEWAFFPVAVGFLFGALFVYAADVFMSSIGIQSPNLILAQRDTKKTDGDNGYTRHSVYYSQQSDISEVGQGSRANAFTSIDFNLVKQRRGDGGDRMSPTDEMMKRIVKMQNEFLQWRRILLLIIAITVHNIPEGLAVGVGFGAIGKTPLSTFNKAKNLALGIGIQNFPEGMAVSLPLRGAGHSVWWAFWYGQLSGMVEPIAGVLGALAVSLCNPVLPYALGFAAGAMIFVVVDDIIPEAQTRDNGRLASGWCIVGFIVMMVLDVALG
ncbi:LOW QUALITY PROTEIN: zinc transporter ZIP11-like [Homarus americanus]|uniref:LOW QUALITY PROTEIN: zinc transporter ZIP11-like n=1 Tax=Homarus americanus TaxID=6706 RepID=UPI001C44E079|nr:LOW QUALITY PROTEIN: zinc transporter ZIP11-like [Homarus americanus]